MYTSTALVSPVLNYRTFVSVLHTYGFKVHLKLTLALAKCYFAASIFLSLSLTSKHPSCTHRRPIHSISLSLSSGEKKHVRNLPVVLECSQQGSWH